MISSAASPRWRTWAAKKYCSIQTTPLHDDPGWQTEGACFHMEYNPFGPDNSFYIDYDKKIYVLHSDMLVPEGKEFYLYPWFQLE